MTGRTHWGGGPGRGTCSPSRQADDRARGIAAGAAYDSSFTEVIDSRLGSVRARGHLTPQAADMLRGTVEALRRSGHDRILLDLGGVQAVSDAGLHAIRSLQDRIEATGGHLTVLDADADRG